MSEVAPGLFHRGPPLDAGPLPTLFYFALSGPDSLELDPFNQPVRFAQERLPLRAFSLTLPFHEPPAPPEMALEHFRTAYARGEDPLSPFLDRAEQALEWTLHQGLADPQHLFLAGLSRGAFVALHFAARESRFRKVCGFAPLLQFGHPPDPARLKGRSIWLSIGHQDTRVGTEHTLAFSQAIAAHTPISLLLHPSIGRQGHGTPPEIFAAGAQWLTS